MRTIRLILGVGCYWKFELVNVLLYEPFSCSHYKWETLNDWVVLIYSKCVSAYIHQLSAGIIMNVCWCCWAARKWWGEKQILRMHNIVFFFDWFTIFESDVVRARLCTVAATRATHDDDHYLHSSFLRIPRIYWCGLRRCKNKLTPNLWPMKDWENITLAERKLMRFAVDFD